MPSQSQNYRDQSSSTRPKLWIRMELAYIVGLA